MMMSVIVYSFLFLQCASSQYSDDIFKKIFQRSFTQGNLDYSDYNSLCNCGFPAPCHDVGNDYDIYDDSNVEVVYANPEQIDTLYNYIINRMNTPTTKTVYDETTNKATTQVSTRPEITEGNYTPAYEETPTTNVNEKVDDDHQLPVEDISNEDDTGNQWEFGSLPTSSDTIASTEHPAIDEEMEPTEKTEDEEYNDYDQLKDSEEDRNSVREVEDDTKAVDEVISEENNNSKPDDITSWLN